MQILSARVAALVRGFLYFICEDDILKKSAKNNHRNSKGNSDNENYKELVVKNISSAG